MRYKLINNKTKEEHLCDKITIDGFDYYVSDGKIKESSWCYDISLGIFQASHNYHSYNRNLCKKVVATNNPNIDIPKVVDDYIRKLAQEYRDKISIQLEYDKPRKVTTALHIECGFYDGYHKSQQTHPFTKEDMIKFAEWIINQDWDETELNFPNNSKSTDELLQLWKEQQPKVIYYNG